MLLPVVLRYALALYAECLQTPFHFRLPPLPPPPGAPGVVYISGCSEGKTNGILHKYPFPTPAFRNYQTTLPSSHSLSPSPSSPLSFLTLSLSLSHSICLSRVRVLTPAIFQQETSCFASVSSHGKIDGDRQRERGDSEGVKHVEMDTTLKTFRRSCINSGIVFAHSDYIIQFKGSR